MEVRINASFWRWDRKIVIYQLIDEKEVKATDDEKYTLKVVALRFMDFLLCKWYFDSKYRWLYTSKRRQRTEYCFDRRFSWSIKLEWWDDIPKYLLYRIKWSNTPELKISRYLPQLEMWRKQHNYIHRTNYDSVCKE